jgi:hypothetical protein
MPQICHQHCPGGGGSHVAAVALVGAGAVVVSVIAAYIGYILLAAGATVSVLAVAGVWYLVHVLRRDQFTVTRRHELQALPRGEAAVAGRGSYQALVAQQRDGLPDRVLSDVVILRQGLLAGDAAGDVSGGDPVADVVGDLAPRRQRRSVVDDHGDNAS